MPSPSSAATPVLMSDKRLAQRAAGLRRDLDEAESTCAALADRAAGAVIRKRCAIVLKSLAALEREADARRVARQLDALQKEADALHERACTLEVEQLALADWRQAHASAQAHLKAIQAQLSTIRQSSAADPIVRERDALRNALAAADQQDDYVRRMGLYRACLPRLESLAERSAVVGRFVEWYDGIYVRQHERTLAEIRRCTAERCRRTLEAELEFIGEAVKKKLAASDVRGVEAVGVKPLQEIARVAMRVGAASPALDRELLRLAERLARLGAPAAETAELRKLAAHKKTAWPAAAECAGVERAMAAFQAALARLAARIETLPVARPAGATA